MPLSSCARCGRMFNKATVSVCPACLPAENADTEKVREVLAEHDNLNAEQVAEMADVDLEVVQRMMKDGIVSVVSLDASEIKCGRCGAPAISAAKKLCQSCLEKLNTEMVKAQTSIRLGDKKDVAIGSAYGGVHQYLKDKRRS